MAPLAECSPNKWNRCQVELLELGYDIEKVLGSGSWGTVVKAFALEEPDCKVAIKIIDRSCLDEESWKSIEREIDAMTCLDGHPHVVQLHRVFETYSFVFLVMEFCSEGDLLTLVQESQTGLKEDSSRVIFKQLLEATQHAHQNDYVHRDIKLENVFLADGCSVRMGDWGFARKLTPGEKVSEYCGSVHYSAPEICLAKPYKGFGVDVWSLGVTLYALNSGRLPFWGANEQAIVRKIRFGAYEMVDSFSESLKDLIVKSLEVDASKRLSVEEMLQHPWVTGRPMRKLSHPARLADGAPKFNSSPLPPIPAKFADKRRRAASFAVPILDLQQLNLPMPLPLSPEEEQKAAELCTARRTTRLADVPLLRQTSNATHLPGGTDPISARKSVVQLTARLIAEATEEPNTKTRKVTKLQEFLDNIGGFIHKKSKRRSSTEEHPKKTRRNQEESTIMTKKGSLIRSSSSTRF